MQKKPSFPLIASIPVVLAVLTCIALLIPNVVLPASAPVPAPSGSIIVFVEDGPGKKPLSGATVIIPETGQTAVTDPTGKTDIIKVPILEDESYSSVFPKPWGEVTLLVYKQGYVDCAIFHVNIWENQTRHGPTVLLFPLDADTQNEPFTLTEGPNRIWVKELLDKFRPQQAAE